MKLFQGIVVLFMIPVFVFSINIKLLKNTSEIPGIPERYSPIYGLVMWDNRIAQQLYRWSPKQFTKEVAGALNVASVSSDRQARLLTIFQDEKNTATQDLLAQFFHRPAGSFVPTNAANNPVRLLSPKDMGVILRMVHDAQNNISAIASAAQKSQLFKKLNTDLKRYLQNLEVMKDFKNTYINIFVNALTSALQECSGDEALYPEDTPQSIVLSYLLAKSNTRNDLQDYFRGFLKNDTFELSFAEYSAEELEQFSKITVSIADLQDAQNFADYVCSCIYQEKYASHLPKIVEKQMVDFWGNAFPDCMETVIRNLCNIITYDRQAQTVGQKAPNDIIMSDQLQTFYENPLRSQSAEVGNQLVHQAWAQLSENVDYAVYAQVFDPNNPSLKLKISDELACDGFVVVPNDYQDLSALPIQTILVGDQSYQVFIKQVDGATYWLLPKSAQLACCELVPIKENMVILLNNNFNLNLYDDARVSLESNFCKTYFSLLCKKVGWTLSTGMNAVLNQPRNSSERLSLSLENGQPFDVDLVKNHGSILAKQEKKSTLTSDVVIGMSDEAKQAILLSLSTVPFDQFAYDMHASARLQKLLPFWETLNPFDRIDFMQSIFGYQNGQLLTDTYAKNVILSFALIDDPYMPMAAKIAEISSDTSLKIDRQFFEAVVDIHTYATGNFDAALMYVQALKARGMDITTKISDLYTLLNQTIEQSLNVSILDYAYDAIIFLGTEHFLTKEQLTQLYKNIRIRNQVSEFLSRVQDGTNAYIFHTNQEAIDTLLPMIHEGFISSSPKTIAKTYTIVNSLLAKNDELANDQSLLSQKSIRELLSLPDKKDGRFANLSKDAQFSALRNQLLLKLTNEQERVSFQARLREESETILPRSVENQVVERHISKPDRPDEPILRSDVVADQGAREAVLLKHDAPDVALQQEQEEMLEKQRQASIAAAKEQEERIEEHEKSGEIIHV